MIIGPWWCYEVPDELNLHNTRNIDNTPRSDFNCGGYALETFTWYAPCLEERERDYIFDPYYNIEKRLAWAVENMIAEFNGLLREIDGIDELREGEYAIAFRLSTTNSDFHFVKRCANGVWRQKRGGFPRIETMTTEEVKASVWYNGLTTYDGPIVLLAKKRA